MVTFVEKQAGDKDETVRDYQWMLRRIGYSVHVTGEFCKRFERNVKVFQGDLRLAVSGKIDELTAEKLHQCYRNWT